MRRIGSVAAVGLLLLAGCSGGHPSSAPSGTPDEARFVAEVQAADAAGGYEFDRAEALRTGYAYCRAMAGVKAAGGSQEWMSASGLADVPEAAAAVRAAGALCPQEGLK